MVEPLFSYNIDFFLKNVFTSTSSFPPLSSLCVQEPEKIVVLFLKQCCVLVDYACKQFLIYFQRNQGAQQKKKKKGKTISFDPMVCLFGLGPQEDRFPC